MGARRRRGPKGVLSRRRFLHGAAAGAASAVALPLLSACSESEDGERTLPASERGVEARALTVSFRHGIASGDPLPDRVIFWTRVTADASSPVAVELVVARDALMSDVVQRTPAVAEAASDYTVKIDQAGLLPATTYYYRFTAGATQSAIGRTRTAPLGATARVRLGVVSCASYAHGVFNVYRRLAQRADLDAIVHLGDYIYEYGTGDYGTARPYQPANECLTLDDYRTRHAYYKLDPDLKELHRQHPFITVWDDHETANNSYKDGAENHTPGIEGVWSQRKAWGIQAYAEWLPIRLPDRSRPERIYRRFRYGDLADLVMLDTRLLARDKQVSLINAAAINDPARNMLGAEQRDFLSDALDQPGVRWKLLGQQVMFGQLKLPSLPQLSGITGMALPQLSQALDGVAVVGTGGVVFNADQWDGYNAERKRVFDLLESKNIQNAVVLTGDIHSSWGMDLTRDPSNLLAYNALTGKGSLGVEFVAPSVTSPGLNALAGIEPVVRLLNPHMKYIELAKRGYLLLDVTHERVQGEWWYVDTIATASTTESLGAAFMTRDGAPHLTRAAQASVPAASAPLVP